MEYIKGEKHIQLPAVDYTLDKPTLKALEGRKSGRNYKPDAELSVQEISNLIWATYGKNRSDGKGTAPLLWNVGVFAATKHGIYKHNSEDNSLNLITETDIRDKITSQGFVKEAPVVFIFTINTDDMTQSWVDETGGKMFYVGNQLGTVSQNLYVYASATDLATVAVSWFNHDVVTGYLDVKGNEKTYLVQPVGREK